MKTFNKKEYQRNYYLLNKDKIRLKSQEYYYNQRYNKTLEEMINEREENKPKFTMRKGNFIITFD